LLGTGGVGVHSLKKNILTQKNWRGRLPEGGNGSENPSKKNDRSTILGHGVVAKL